MEQEKDEACLIFCELNKYKLIFFHFHSVL